MIYIFIEDRADFIASSKTGIAMSPRKLNSFSSGNGIEGLYGLASTFLSSVSRLVHLQYF